MANLIEKKTLELGVLQGEGETSDMEHINILQCEVNELVELEELKWRQRSKHEWLQHGDKNSKFFHALVNQQRNSSSIKSIKDAGGAVLESFRG